jgi:hypothetical protein
MKITKQIHDSKSLGNYTISPGWTRNEVEVLKIALMKYGIGKWRKIKRCKCLPGKTVSQMVLQTQRLLGQQSIAEFMGIRVDLEKVLDDNKKKTVIINLKKEKEKIIL